MNPAIFGLKSSEMDYMVKLFSKFSEVEQVIIFGSRTTGKWQKSSDVDLAIVGKNLSPVTVRRIHFNLEEESSMPYFFNVLDYGSIDNEAFKEEVDKHGKVIYSKAEVLHSAS